MTLSSHELRRIIITEAKRAGVGHIGSALSIADIMVALYGHVLRIPALDDPERDRFVLSKGHAALALYGALYLKEWITRQELSTYCGEGTRLGVHPEHLLHGVEFSTGSLGQGLSFGVGAGLAARLQGSARRIFVLLSDAECNEGSVWEAIMFAAHHRLANIIAIVDVNGQQAFGYTQQILDLSPLADKWKTFSWDVHEVDGHNVQQMTGIIDGLDTKNGSPHVLIARTIFGKGVSYMENKIKWHYYPMSDQEYQNALREIKDNHEKSFY
jgi:transketolase